MHRVSFAAAAAAAVLCVACLRAAVAPAAAPPESAPWAEAHKQGPLSADETRDFMRRLAAKVEEEHLKTAADSPQRGMVYEYVDHSKMGQLGQWVQGEALDTMHDGAWYAAAMVNAFRATGDAAYRDFLVRLQLPFYLKMLNHSDELFIDRNDAAPGAHIFPKTHYLIAGEKGYVPYWWDDGASVSLERALKKQALGEFACRDNLAGKPNPDFRLDGHSLGMSNHMAQDLGVMVQLAWLLFRDAPDDAGRRLAADLAEAARNLHENRMRHHGYIPMCVAPAALAGADAALLKRLPDPAGDWSTANHYTRALYDFRPGAKCAVPGFADDQQYRYYHSLARTGGAMPPALAFKTVYDAWTEPLLWRHFCDDIDVPPGVNRGEFGLDLVDGAFPYYHSDRKFASFLGSRMGPQSLICMGWAIQILRAMPGVWDAGPRSRPEGDLRAPIDDPLSDDHAQAAPAVALGPAEVSIMATRTALVLEGRCPAAGAALKVYSRPDAAGSHAVVTIAPDGKSAATNDAGEALVADVQVRPQDGGLVFKITMPWTVTKGQKPWANGVEFGRYSIACGGAVRNFTLATPERQVLARLEREVGCGLRTWDAIFRHYGYIPTHIGRNKWWDGVGDSGGYAHLISAGAQWLLVLDGKRDWEVHGVPGVAGEHSDGVTK
jgi:hypothetical protein